jgi:hypothetical protein
VGRGYEGITDYLLSGDNLAAGRVRQWQSGGYSVHGASDFERYGDDHRSRNDDADDDRGGEHRRAINHSEPDASGVAEYNKWRYARAMEQGAGYGDRSK